MEFNRTVRIAVVLLILHFSEVQAQQHSMTNNAHPDSIGPRFLTAQTASNHPDPAYLLTLEQWRSRHADALTQPNGWLSLTALEWLKPGDTTVGSAAGNTLRLVHAPAHLATFRVAGDSVSLVAPAGDFPLGTTLNNHPALPIPLSVNDELRHGTHLIIVIKRGDRLYLRVRDTAAAGRQNFSGLHWYAPDMQYRVTARWVPAAMAGNLVITNVLGQTIHESSPGMAEFTLFGQKIRLFPIVEPGENNALFFIFRDATSKSRTYGAGRFLYTDLPSNGIARSGTIILDFNKAENPPCAYTPYATCPLPPQQNRFTVPIPAGELRYHD